METRSTSSGQATGPKDIFLHLLSVIALYISVGSFIALTFQYINYWMPDPLQGGYYGDSIRWAISILIVIFPVYVWTIRYLNKGYKEVPARMEMKSRKWLVYLTIFLAALLMIGDLVALVYNLLQGEFTTRFLAKVLTVLLTSGAVFIYYLWQGKGQPDDKRGQAKMLSVGVSAIVALSIISGFFIVGSPKTERSYQFDDQRTSHLQAIQGELFTYWQGKQKLPENLSDLKNDVNGFIVPTDPETGMGYEYRKINDLSFEICANYNNPDRSTSAPVAVKDPYYYMDSNWQHDAGRFCFQRTIDPELLKPFPKGI